MNINWKSVGAGVLVGLASGALLSKLLSRVGNKLLGFFKTIVDATRKEFNEQVEHGNYKFDDDFDAKQKEFSSPAKLQQWLKQQLRQHRYNGILLQGHLYLFNYDNPKTFDALEFYDRSPLVLAFGTYMANTGNLVEYGVNLHYLPAKIRKAFMTDIFELFRKQYKGKMYSNEPRPINEFDWQQLQTFVDKYGIDFAVRSYITTRRTATIAFDYVDWSTAVLVPSAGIMLGGRAVRRSYDDRFLERLYNMHRSNKRKL